MRRTFRISGIAWIIAPLLLGVGSARGQDPGSKPAGEHPLEAAIRIATTSHERAKSLADYEATFTKSELVRGRTYASQMDMKFRREPMSVYLRFVNPEHVGREVLYVEGQNNNMMLAHDTGLKALAGTVPVDPHGAMALAEARHPITQIGLENMVGGILKQWEKESAFGESDVKYYAEAKLGGRAMLVIESTHPRPRNQFPFAMTRLWIDQETKLPVRVQNYEFPQAAGGKPVLVEDYTYTNIETDVELTARDFDVRNPAYEF